jgi:putative aminopeptidase
MQCFALRAAGPDRARVRTPDRKIQMRPISAVVVLTLGWQCSIAHAQKSPGPTDWQRVLRMPAVSGYEKPLGEEIRKRLRDLSPKTDNLGNIYVRVGSGTPHRLIVTPIDEPGYVISEITEGGYLRVQRLPQRPPNAMFDELNFAQPVTIATRGGNQVSGAFAGLSVHLQSGRQYAPKMALPDELYVDIGAKNAEEVRKAGVDLLDPLVVSRQWFRVGNSGEAGPAVGDRFGAYALVHVLEEIAGSKAKGTTTIAFLTQEWTGNRGLNRILTEANPDELIYVGRVAREDTATDNTTSNKPRPGTGVIVGSSPGPSASDQLLAAEIQTIAEKEHIPIHLRASKGPQIPGHVKGAPIPKRWVELGVPTLWPVTPAEYGAWKDIEQLQRLIEAYLHIPKPIEGSKQDLVATRGIRRSEDLIGSYGASGHEEAVREVVLDRLNVRLRSMVQTDTAGNLVLHVGGGKRDEKTPRVTFVAHMDEIGYGVKKIEEDGRLQVEVLGGGYAQYFLGHVVLVHKKDGSQVGGVLELPMGWDVPGFEWPSATLSIDEPQHVYLGTSTKEETEKLGIAAEDFVTIPKRYRRLLGTRATARGFDDRVGCAALITAANAIGAELPGRDVTFVWSTEEEVGSKGAAAFAEQAAREGRNPDFVFAVDMFVSSDSPLESKRLADAELGRGFVVRAVDNSNLVALQYVDRVVALAKGNGIPAQYGVGGGNDGAVFLRFGSVDVALGWPVRYSHSPAELIDTKDFDSLGKIVELLAREW